jgi:hypothetical protein
MTERRPFLLDAGESLLVLRDPLRALVKHVATARATGLNQVALTASRLSEVPIPVNGGRCADRRRDGVRAEAMWWPLLWLPERLTRRVNYQVVGGDLWVVDPNGLFDGEPRAVRDPIAGYPVHRETTDSWVVRVLLEMEISGLYDTDSGTWSDVLALVGLDVEDSYDRARVDDWLDGASDSTLDELNRRFFCDGDHIPDGEAPSWAFQSAISSHHDLLEASWTFGSDALREVLDEVGRDVHRGDLSETAEVRFIVRLICQLSNSLLQHYTEREAEWWVEMLATVDAFAGTADQMVDGPLDVIGQHLEEVQRASRARLETIVKKYRE